MSCRVRTGCVNRLSWCQWYVVMRKKKEKKGFKALELSTTVRLELLSAFVLRQEAYGYVIFSFFSTNVTSQKTLRLAAVLHLACEAISLSASRRRIPFSRVVTWLACVARRAFTIQPRKTAFTDVCFLRFLKLCLLATKQRNKWNTCESRGARDRSIPALFNQFQPRYNSL